MMKRLFEIVMAGLALVVFLPFGIIISVVLRFTGEGEIFFLQDRIGIGGKKIRLIKFATMLKDSPKTGTITAANDPRILPVGRFLRNTKINEIPQFLNVLMGDMALVGPRPLAPGEFELYSAEVRATITKMKPGLTGMGSLFLRNEESILSRAIKDKALFYRETIIPLKGALEKWYFENRSFWIDIKIIAATALSVIFPRLLFYLRWFEIGGLLKGSALHPYFEKVYLKAGGYFGQ